MSTVIVVGAGLFGSIAAAWVRKLGRAVTTVDAGRPDAGSPAAGCVIAPSWLSSLSDPQRRIALDVLDELYGLRAISFRTHLSRTFAALRVNPTQILAAPDIRAEVLSVGDGVVLLRGGQTLTGLVLVAAGIWSATLVAMPAVRALYGASLWLPNQQMDPPQLRVFAPYRQALAFNIEDRLVWAGDGTAVLPKTWQHEAGRRTDQLRDRIQRYFQLDTRHANVQVRAGARPYVDGHRAGYFARVHPRTWVSTGGAKNGVALAAWQAHCFAEALP